MKKSTIEIKIVNQENGEVTEVKYSTDEIKKFQEIADELLHTFYENF